MDSKRINNAYGCYFINSIILNVIYLLMWSLFLQSCRFSSVLKAMCKHYYGANWRQTVGGALAPLSQAPLGANLSHGDY